MKNKSLMAVFCMVLIVSSSFSVSGISFLDRYREDDEKNLGEIVLINVDKYEPTVIPSDYVRNKDSPVWIHLSGNTLEGYFFGGSEGKSLDTTFGDLKIRSFDIDRTSVSKYVSHVTPIPPKGGYKVDSSGNLDLGVMKVYFKKMPIEENIPDTITLNFSAIFQFDYKSGFGVFGRQDLYFDNVKVGDSGSKNIRDIWDGKGSLELVSIEGDKANFILRESDGDEIDKFSLKVGQYEQARLKDAPTFLGNRVRFFLKSLGGVDDIATIKIFGKNNDYVEGMNLYTGSDWVVNRIANPRIYLLNEETKAEIMLDLRETQNEGFQFVDCEDIDLEDESIKSILESESQETSVEENIPIISGTDVQDGPSGEKLIQDGLYCSAIKEYEKSLSYVSDINKRDEINYELAKIYNELGDPWNALVHFNEISYGREDGGEVYEKEGIAGQIIQAEGNIGGGSFGCGTVDGLSVCLRNIKINSEEGTVFSEVDGVRKELRETGGLSKIDNIVLSGKFIDYKGNSKPFEWKVADIRPGYVVLRKIMDGGADDTKRVFIGETVELVKTQYSSQQGKSPDNVQFKVVDIDSPLTAVVSVLPGDGNNFATSHFSVHLPIEKSLIQWTPEQIDSMIEKTQATIKKLDSVIDNLGKFIKGMKIACYSVFSYLSVKNAFFLNNKGRKEVFQEYYDDCKKEAQNDPNRISKCLKEKEKEMEDRIVVVSEAITNAENLIKRMNNKEDAAYREITSRFGQGDDFVEFLKNEQLRLEVGYDNNKLEELLKESYLTPGKVSDNFSKANDAISRLKGVTDESKRRRILSSIYDETIRGVNIGENDIVRFRDRDILDALKAKEFDTNHMKEVGKIILTEGEYRVYDYSQKDFVVLNPVLDETEKQYVLNNRVVFKDSNGILYLAQVDVEGTSSEYSTGVENKNYFDETNRLTYFDFKGSKGTFKGAGEANFVRVSYDDARAGQRTYTVYNVGDDKKIDMSYNEDSYSYTYRDDMYLFSVSYALSGDRNKEGIDFAKVYRDIENEYNKRIRNDGKDTYEKRSLSSVASGISQARCEDYMKISDCELLYNVCDPVMCPASRFNLNRNWKVSDVVQTGIIGSLVLGWGNGDKLPICLTGVNAGLENIRSKFMGFEDCLKSAKDNGESVGICNTVRSVYMCEILWREGLSIFGNLGSISDIISRNVFKKTDGFGGYLDWTNSWNRLGDSVSYFTSVYATSAFSSYKARNLGEFGTEVCKSAIYGKNPGVGSFVGELLEPSSPFQFTGFFDENVVTTLEGGRSQYRIYYHIYAGRNEKVNYIVYLKGPGRADKPVTSSTGVIQTRTLDEGDYVDESFPIEAQSGYTQMCIRINNQESCGFGRVSSSFSANYAKDLIVEGDLNSEIDSEEECRSGSTSVGSSTLYSGLTSSGISRTCSRYDPDGDGNQWVRDGNCGIEGVDCYVDWSTVDLKHAEKNRTAWAGMDTDGDGQVDSESEAIISFNTQLDELDEYVERIINGWSQEEIKANSLGYRKELYNHISGCREIIDKAEEIAPILSRAHRKVGQIYSLMAASYGKYEVDKTADDPTKIKIPDKLEIKLDVSGIDAIDLRYEWDGKKWKKKKTLFFREFDSYLLWQLVDLPGADSHKIPFTDDTKTYNEVHVDYGEFSKDYAEGLKMAYAELVAEMNAAIRKNKDDELRGVDISCANQEKVYGVDVFLDLMPSLDRFVFQLNGICGDPSSDEAITEETERTEEGVSGDLNSIFGYARNNQISNGQVLKSCDCGSNCEDYANFVEQYSSQNGVDPVLVLSLMIQENNCVQDDTSGGSVGVMQVSEGSFDDICKGNVADEFEEIQGDGNVAENIECGVKILKNKYSTYGNGVYQSSPYIEGLNKNLVDNCVDSHPKYGNYVGWDAALRGYNGWGCGEGADIDYVEKVNTVYNTLSSVSLDEAEVVECSDISDSGEGWDNECYSYEYCFVKEKPWWKAWGDNKCTSCYDASCEDIGAMAKCDGSCGSVLDCEWSDSECIKKNLISDNFQESEETSMPITTQKDVVSVAEEVIGVANEEVEENIDEAKEEGGEEAQEKIEDSVEIAEEVVELVESSGCQTEIVDAKEEELKLRLEELDKKIRESENIAMPEVSIRIEEFSEDVEEIDYYVCPPTMVSDEEIAQKILEIQQKIAESKKKRIEELDRKIRESENIPMPEIQIMIEDELEEINLDEFVDTVHDLQCLPEISFETHIGAERIIEDIEDVSVGEEIKEEIMEVMEQPATCVADSSLNPLCNANNRDNFVQGQVYGCYPSISCREDSNVGQADCNIGESCCRPACESMFSNRECVDTDYYECTSDIAKYYCPGDSSVVCCERGDQISYSDSVKGRLNSMMSGNRDYIDGDPLCTGVNCAGFVRRAFNHAFGEGRHFITGVGGNAWDMPKHVDERDGKVYWFDWRNGEIFTNYDSLSPGDVIGFHYAESDYRPGTELGAGNTEEIDFTHVALYLGEKNGEHYITHLYHVPAFLQNPNDDQKNEAVRVEPIDTFLNFYGSKFSIRALMKPNPERLYRPVPNYESENYVVESGDTIISIAKEVKRFRDDVEEVAWLIANYNSLVDSTRIFEGAVIGVPLMGEVGEYKDQDALYSAIVKTLNDRNIEESSEWARVVHTYSSYKTPDYIGLVLAFIYKESSFREKFNLGDSGNYWGRKEIWAQFDSWAFNDDSHSLGCMQLQVRRALEISKENKWGFDRDDIHDQLLTKDGCVKWGVEYMDRVVKIYAGDPPEFTTENLRFIFVDYNSGYYTSRNSAFQKRLNDLAGSSLVIDGDLLIYDEDDVSKPISKASNTEKVIRRVFSSIGQGEIRNQLLKEKNSKFENTYVYQEVSRMWIERFGQQNFEYGAIPDISKYGGISTVKSYVDDLKNNYNLFCNPLALACKIQF